MEITCRKCEFLDEQWCPVLGKRIHAIDLDKIDIFCTPEKRKKAIVKFSIKVDQKYPRLESVFAVLGYKFNNNGGKKTTHETQTINKHPDGTYKSKFELLKELKDLRNTRAKIVHPDKNPGDEEFYNAEMEEVNKAFKRGVRIIQNRYKHRERKWGMNKSEFNQILDAFTG